MSTSTDGVDVLRKVALQDADLPSGLHLQMLPDGDQVAGQVSLDICNADFPSEAKRTARFQQAARSGDTLAVNNENIAYSSKEDAAEAFSEITQAVQNCPPDSYLPSKVAGVPPLKFQLQLISDDQLGPVAADHVGVTGTASTRAGQTTPITQVFQRRGRVVVGIYGRDLATIKPLLPIAERRLAALSAAEAGE